MASKKKLVTSGIALTLAAAIGLGGTFAWQSINQTALNEASDIVNPGGRLHNDQHWVSDMVNDTDIYVENFTDPNNGGNDIFARVRLEEYMEVVMNYGVAGAETVEVIAGSKTPVEGSTYTADNATHKNEFTYTYAVHKFTDDDKTKDFWKWTAGSEDSDDAYFIPTYNLNKDSLLADLNGEYVDTLGGISNREAAQYEYTEVDSESTASGYEVYDGDVNTLDEVKMDDLKDLIENGTDAENYATFKDNIVLSDEKVTHEAAKIGDSNGLISMEEWLELLGDDEYDADTHGNYWVYDEDGWVYWSSPIKAGTSTGRLLDSISLNHVMDDTWYYAINVVAQFVTANDVGKSDNTGFYDTTAGTVPSEDAETLLETIGVDMPKDDVNGDDDDDAVADHTLKMNAATNRNGVYPYISVDAGETIQITNSSGTTLGESDLMLWLGMEKDEDESTPVFLTKDTDYTFENGFLKLKDSNNFAEDGVMLQATTTDMSEGGIIIINDDGALTLDHEGITVVDATVAKVNDEIKVTLDGTNPPAETEDHKVKVDVNDADETGLTRGTDFTYDTATGKLVITNEAYVGKQLVVWFYKDIGGGSHSYVSAYVHLVAASTNGEDSSSGGQTDPDQHTLSIAGVYGDDYVCDLANLGGRGIIAFTATLDNDAETSIDVSKLTGNLYESAAGGEPISTGTYFLSYDSQNEYILPNKVKDFPEGEVTYYFSVTYTDGDNSVTSNRIAYKFLKNSAALTQAGATITVGRDNGVCLTLDGVENITDGYSWNNSMVDQIKMTYDGAELKAKLRSADEDDNMEIYLWTTEDAFENIEDRYHVWMVINYAQETVMFTSGGWATYNVPFAIEINQGGTAYKGTLTVVSGN